MLPLIAAALVLLAIDPPSSHVDEHRVYIGTSSNSYHSYQDFPATNRFALVVTNSGKVFLACSALNYEFGESELSSEIQVLIGQVQLGPTVAGPWVDYMTVPIEITEPARFVRVKLQSE